ncbi:Retrovirus-related Pol polyprotein from transposon TNT 1-94 [Dendrobium catenatum]|uniref:Retrovirus-related Pol polyprotein from transposon TNT 1-94 n=1 Tax=Dendrobium catenatum TaxID=906689 RepID=A0A2I0VRB9_9ASPA|nr:Retrovirus-related Pol polyprotein from transposon TNT 1-94 [Dendrobium catenatum]
MCKRFTNLLNNYGISHQVSCPYTPEQNGVVERKHRHLLETTRTLLYTASVPNSFWPDAVLTATYLINRMPSPNTNNKSPYELLHQKQPEYAHLRTFGCACFPLIPASNRNKFQPKSHLCVFLGYSEKYKGYKCFDIVSYKIIMSRHVKFDEQYFPFFKLQQNVDQERCTHLSPLFLTPTSIAQGHNLSANSSIEEPPNMLINADSSVNNFETQEVQTSPPMPDPPVTQPVMHPMTTRYKTGSLKPVNRLNLIHTNTRNASLSTPSNYTEAIKYPEWRSAMADEFLALQIQGTWTLVPKPSDSSVLGCKWTYRTKLNSDGSISKYKARLVALGNHQEFGLDYTETFSPVVKLPTIRILLAVALQHNW